MLKRILKHFRWGRTVRKGRVGFIYEPKKEGSPLAVGDAGDVIRVDSTPPWMVVDHSKDSIVFTNWPGVLWKVEVIQPAPDSKQEADFYTRAIAIRLIEKATATELFGANGRPVENILSQAAGLELIQIESVNPPCEIARQAYSKAWNTWLGNNHQNGGQLQHGDTLGVGSRGYDSPIGRGLVLLFNVFHKRAQEIEGDSAFTVDDAGDVHFVPKWQYAFDAAKHAAMACGAPDLLSRHERALLKDNWAALMEIA